MVFPEVKRAERTRWGYMRPCIKPKCRVEYHNFVFLENDLLVERRSRGEWAKALAKELANRNSVESRLNDLIEELMKQAEEDLK